MRKLKWSNVFKILFHIISFMFGFKKVNFPKDATMKEINYASFLFVLTIMSMLILIMFLCAYMFNLTFK